MKGLPTIHFSDDASDDTVFSVLKGWKVHVDLRDGRRITGIVSGNEYPILVLTDDNSDWEAEVDWEQVESVEVL